MVEQTNTNYESQKQTIKSLQQDKKKMAQVIKVFILDNRRICGGS